MNIIGLGVFGIIFLLILGFISSAGAIGSASDSTCTSADTDTYCKNYREMVALSCHMPVFNGWDTSVTLDSNVNDYSYNGNGTYYECGFNISGQFTARYSRDYQATAFSAIPIGWLGFVGDTLTQFFFKAGALISLIINFVSPMGFNILGYDITDLVGIALALVIAIYALCYLFIGAMIWKIVTPFAGAG